MQRFQCMMAHLFQIVNLDLDNTELYLTGQIYYAFTTDTLPLIYG
jgi:hypothetical protein